MERIEEPVPQTPSHGEIGKTYTEIDLKKIFIECFCNYL